MESEFQRFSREARSFADILRRMDEYSTGTADTDSAPHIETLDFDRLCELLDGIADQLNTAQQLDRDAATVRQWLIGRIESLQRGRSAIMDERRIANESSSHQTATTGELIHRFEEASASLRASAATGTIKSRRSRSEYQEFKS